MKKNIVISGSLEDMVTYCSAIYELEKEIDSERLNQIIAESPIFENKNFYTRILGNLSKTTVTRNTKMFIHGATVTLQMRYEMLKVVDIELTKNDERWIKNDIKHILEHFELLLKPFE